MECDDGGFLRCTCSMRLKNTELAMRHSKAPGLVSIAFQLVGLKSHCSQRPVCIYGHMGMKCLQHAKQQDCSTCAICSLCSICTHVPSEEP